jgi:hypothetical protein
MLFLNRFVSANRLISVFFFLFSSSLFCNQKNSSYPKNQNQKTEVVVKTTFSSTHSHYKIKQLDEKTYVWLEENCDPFSEIILSWNSEKPEIGQLIFFVSCKINNEWTGWKKQASWGSKNQATYSKKESPRLKTMNSCAMIPKPFFATGFRIKVVAENGAKIKSLHALFCSLVREQLFKPERGPLNLSTIKIKKIENYAQSQMELNHRRNKDMCYPTSMTILMRYLNSEHLGKTPSPHEAAIVFAENARDKVLDIYGCWPLNAAQVYEDLDGKFHFHAARLNGFKDIHRLLKKKIPVAVSIRGPINGGAGPYKNGHLILVVGWNKKHQRVLCIDPGFKTKDKTRVSYDVDEFLKAWERSRRLSYIAIPRS